MRDTFFARASVFQSKCWRQQHAWIAKKIDFHFAQQKRNRLLLIYFLYIPCLRFSLSLSLSLSLAVYQLSLSSFSSCASELSCVSHKTLSDVILADVKLFTGPFISSFLYFLSLTLSLPSLTHSFILKKCFSSLC